MWTGALLPGVYTLRTKCQELLDQAVAEKNLEKIQTYNFIKGYLCHDDCLDRRRWPVMRPCHILSALGYDYDEIMALEKQIEEKSVYRGKLRYTDENGQLCTVEAMLDPEVEEYYVFKHFGVFKIRYGWDFYSLCRDGTWKWDPEAQRRYHDNGYDYSYASIVQD